MAKVKLSQLKEMIRKAVKEQIEEQISGGISVPSAGAGAKAAPQRAAQPGGAKGLVASGMTVEQLAQQALANPAQKDEYLEAIGMKSKFDVANLAQLIKGAQDPQLRKVYQDVMGLALKKMGWGG